MELILFYRQLNLLNVRRSLGMLSKPHLNAMWAATSNGSNIQYD